MQFYLTKHINDTLENTLQEMKFLGIGMLDVIFEFILNLPCFTNALVLLKLNPFPCFYFFVYEGIKCHQKKY